MANFYRLAGVILAVLVPSLRAATTPGCIDALAGPPAVHRYELAIGDEIPWEMPGRPLKKYRFLGARAEGGAGEAVYLWLAPGAGRARQSTVLRMSLDEDRWLPPKIIAARENHSLQSLLGIERQRGLDCSFRAAENGLRQLAALGLLTDPQLRQLPRTLRELNDESYMLDVLVNYFLARTTTFWQGLRPFDVRANQAEARADFLARRGFPSVIRRDTESLQRHLLTGRPAIVDIDVWPTAGPNHRRVSVGGPADEDKDEYEIGYGCRPSRLPWQGHSVLAIAFLSEFSPAAPSPNDRILVLDSSGGDFSFLSPREIRRATPRFTLLGY